VRSDLARRFRLSSTRRLSKWWGGVSGEGDECRTTVPFQSRSLREGGKCRSEGWDRLEILFGTGGVSRGVNKETSIVLMTEKKARRRMVR